jgi:hypothetical protein
MRYDDHATEYVFDSISGFGLGRCAFLGYRRAAEALLDPRRMESWVVEPSAETSENGDRRVRLDLGLRAYLSSLWYSPMGATYTTASEGKLHMRRPMEEEGFGPWSPLDFGADVELHGVWGLDDQDVYVWGRDAWRPLMWHVGRNGVSAMPAPPGRTTSVRGLGPELLYAAGDHGFVARWNGSQWRRVNLPTSRPITGLFIGDADDLWLTTANGKLFEGTSHGWAVRLQFDGPLYDVARWRGAVWVAAGRRGLFRLVDRADRLEPAALDVSAISLETRGDLLALAEDYLAFSTDGCAFEISCRDVLTVARRGEEPLWEKPRERTGA